jgi:hypothetical protein
MANDEEDLDKMDAIEEDDEEEEEQWDEED